MLPNSVTLGEKSTSIAIVAALMNRIVTIGVRKTATLLLFRDRQQLRREMGAARSDQAGNSLRAQPAEPLDARLRADRLFRYDCSAAPSTCTRFSAK